MKTKLLSLIALLLVSFCSMAQNQFWSDEFEDTGSPSAGSRTLSIGEIACAAGTGTGPTNGYFRKIGTSEVLPAALFTGAQGVKYWGAMNLDAGTGCTGGALPYQTITWSSINIAGKTGMSFKGLFGGNTGASFQGVAFNTAGNGWAMDSMAVEYRIDGGAWTKLVAFYSNNTVGGNAGPLALDNNNDFIGDGTALSSALAEYTANITGTGSSLDLRFDIFNNNAYPGSMAIDNFRLLAADPCTAPSVTANQPNRTICAAGSTTLPMTATGTGLTYQWQVNPGTGTFGNITNGGVYSNATTATLSITGATSTMSGYTYKCVVTGTCGTATSNASTLTVSAPSGSTVKTNVSCNGGNNGSATVTPSGGVSPYTYSWAPNGGTAATASGIGANIYTVTITDNIGCTGTATASVTQPTVLGGSISTQTNILCNGAATGAATVLATGGTPSYTYSWAPSGGTAATATGLSANTYTVTITDANNCTKTVNAVIQQPANALSASISAQTNIACNGASTGSATVLAGGGTPGYTYSWAPSGGTAATATGLSAATYTITVTDANSCQKTVNANIQQPNALAIAPSQTNVSCNGGTNGSATATVTGGTPPYTYSWAPSGGTAASATGLAANTYTVTVTDGNLCTKTQTYTITAPNALTASISAQTNIACNGASTGSATVLAGGGTPGYTYSWAPSGGTAATATGLTAATYTITVTDANNCQKTVNANIQQPNALAIAPSQTNISCNGGTNGSATATVTGGTPPYTYSWAPSGGTAASATGLAANTYTVTVTDGNLCTKSQTYTITAPNALTASISAQTNIACNGASTGSATVLAGGGTPGYTYSWAPSGGTAATATGLSAATYTITVTDANSCQKTVNANIQQPNALAIAPSQTNISCNGGTNGSATATVTGGTPPYTYSWAPSGGTNATASGLAANTYTVTVTDGNLCTKSQTYTITAPNALTASISAQTNIACNGASTGSATVLAGGGTPGYTYSWAPSGGTAATATGLSAATYTITVTDANSCQKTVNANIQQPNALAIAPSQTNISCNGGTNGSATATVTGGTPPYTYSWAPSGGTAASATGLAANTYTVTVTDGNLCTKSQTYTITAPNALTASISAQTNIACNGAATGSATVLAGGGTPGYTYSWAPSGGTAATATGLAAATYTITVTDANNCQKTVNTNIQQPNAIVITPSQNNVSCNGGTNGTATASVSGGTGPYTYSWAPSGGTNATATGLAANTYTVTVTDANLCTKSQTYTITAPNALAANISAQTNISCNGGSNGSATVSVTGGTPSYVYSWAPSGGTAATATGLAAQTYTVTVFDNNGCSITKTAAITQPPTSVQVTASNDTNSCSGATVTLNAVATGGTPGYTYSWTPGNISGASPVVNPTVTTTYVVTATDANACTKKDSVIVSVGGVLAQSNQNNSTSIEGSDTSSSNVNVGAFTFLYNDECKIIASVKTNLGFGVITGNVNVIDTVPVLNNRPYLSRVYEITPQNNIAGSVNLYYTQEDFDNYNAYATAHSLPLLPQNPTDQVGIDSIVITKISGTDFANGPNTLIHPDSVKWNATLHFWTVSLHVPSFSFFLLHGSDGSNQPLAINLTSFVVKKENKTAGLYWTTASEQSIVGFAVERSNDGKVFEAIGNVSSKATNGNSTTPLNYNFTDKMPLSGWNFYRLAETDQAGKIAYSDVRSLNFNAASSFSCYPNPTSGLVVIEHNADNDAQLTVRFTDVLGKVVLETKLPVTKGFNKSSVDMSSLSQGMYNMSIIGDASVIFNTRIVKK